MPDGEEERNGGHGFAWFLIGVVFGVAGAIFAPRWAAPYLPSFLGGGEAVEGEVLEKVAESDRILVKVSTPDGLILVTFTQNLEELDLLIGEGDSITLDLDHYRTLVENPSVARVIRSTMSEEPARLPPHRGEQRSEREGEPAESEMPEMEGEAEAEGESQTSPGMSEKTTDAETETDSEDEPPEADVP